MLNLQVSRIQSVEYVDDSDDLKKVCDITVADNHNLFVCNEITENSVLAHNCVADVQFPIAIHKMQMARAKAERIGKHSYGEPYKRLMLTVIDSQIHATSDMEMRGTALDLPYLMSLNEKNSPVNKVIADLEKVVYETKAAKKANKLLVKQSGVPQRGIYGDVDSWVLDINKPAHRQMLFFTVLGLEPVTFNKKGKGKIDKTFQSTYKDVPEVKAYTELVKANKIKGSYIKAIYKRSEEDADMRNDMRLRPQYGFVGVLTGRSNSYNPSLQQIPNSNGEDLAGMMKRCFAAAPGEIKIKLDYSAHEVRVWGILSRDNNIAASFQHGKNLRIKYRDKPSKKLAERIKNEGDIHRVNYSGFTGVPVNEVTPEQRKDSKGITFGAIFGKSVFTLAEELGKTREEMQEIYDNFFGRFDAASKWLDWTSRMCEKEYYTYSPMGLKRNLYGALTEQRAVISALVRRAKNSPIQGSASQIGFMAKRLYDRLAWGFIKRAKIEYQMPILPMGIDVMVHDSDDGNTRSDLFFPAVYLMEYATTEGVRKYVDECFGLKFNVGLEVEFEIGAHQKSMQTWDTTGAHLEKCLRDTLDYQKKVLKFPINVNKDFSAACRMRDRWIPKLERDYPLDLKIIKKDT